MQCMTFVQKLMKRKSEFMSFEKCNSFLCLLLQVNYFKVLHQSFSDFQFFYTQF